MMMNEEQAKRARTFSCMDYSEYKKIFPKSPFLRPHKPPTDTLPAFELPPSSEVLAEDDKPQPNSLDGKNRISSLPPHLFNIAGKMEEEFILEEIADESDSDSNNSIDITPEKVVPPVENQMPANTTSNAIIPENPPNTTPTPQGPPPHTSLSFSPPTNPIPKRRHSFFVGYKMDCMNDPPIFDPKKYKPMVGETTTSTNNLGNNTNTPGQGPLSIHQPVTGGGSIFKFMAGRKKSFQQS